jgi:hypothetical protein
MAVWEKVGPPPWAGGENTTAHPTAQGFFARPESFWKKSGQLRKTGGFQFG